MLELDAASEDAVPDVAEAALVEEPPAKEEGALLEDGAAEESPTEDAGALLEDGAAREEPVAEDDGPVADEAAAEDEKPAWELDATTLVLLPVPWELEGPTLDPGKDEDVPPPDEPDAAPLEDDDEEDEDDDEEDDDWEDDPVDRGTQALATTENAIMLKRMFTGSLPG